MPLSSHQFRGNKLRTCNLTTALHEHNFFSGKQTRPVSRGKPHGLSGTRDSPAVRFSTKKTPRLRRVLAICTQRNQVARRMVIILMGARSRQPQIEADEGV